jgi:hypothetical protein
MVQYRFYFKSNHEPGLIQKERPRPGLGTHGGATKTVACGGTHANLARATAELKVGMRCRAPWWVVCRPESTRKRTPHVGRGF